MAKKVFNSRSDLHDYLEQPVEDALQGPVADYIKDELQQSAAINAAGPYSSPTGGISDIGNMYAQTTRYQRGCDLIVEDIALPQQSVFNTEWREDENQAVDGTMFANWIENGEWMDLKGYFRSGGTQKPKRKRRKFVAPVQDKINQDPNKIVGLIEKEIY